MSWTYLMLAIFFEVLGTSCLKLSTGFTRLLPSIGVVVFYGLSFTGLSFALKQIDVSVAYAIWSGVGITLIALVDIFIFHTDLSPMKIVAIGLIILGAVMLKIL